MLEPAFYWLAKIIQLVILVFFLNDIEMYLKWELNLYSCTLNSKEQKYKIDDVYPKKHQI
ncbi:hypothetical protein BZZ01_05735 [Nostocales cyanobacterium HT-58-2]|nr:hypothetical protein BZZ01_05735 [Nostocales cyanobacterium HT-58-2]